MKLRDMRLPKTRRGNMPEVESIGMDEKYPWGLRLSLDHRSLKRLGIDVDDITTKDNVTITARADVVSLSKSESRDGPGHQEVSFQITKMAVTKVPPKTTIRGMKAKQ